jgi:hypothetical protein
VEERGYTLYPTRMSTVIDGVVFTSCISTAAMVMDGVVFISCMSTVAIAN